MAVSIENARKALNELHQGIETLDQAIAVGVLNLFINQQEKSKVMKNFNDLTAEQQAQVYDRFVLPDDRDNLKVDENFVPFERISGHFVACSVKNNNFHVHGNKQNGR